MPAEIDVAIMVDGLRMRYGAADVLRDVTFQAHPGEILALLGPNGAGKSTTIEILQGFRLRSVGRVAVLGTDPARATERWRARAGIVLQSWRDHGKWRVQELLAHLGSYYAGWASEGTDCSSEGTGPPWDAAELVAAVGLTAQAGQRIGRLSGGQRRRLDVAIGIVGRPDVLFLDDPTAGFDPVARRDFHDLVRTLARDQETTVLLATHNLAEAEQLAERMIVPDGGRIVADGTAGELARRLAGEDEVRWTVAGGRCRQATTDATGFVRDLFARHGAAIGDLDIRRASLRGRLPGAGAPRRNQFRIQRRIRRTAGGGAMRPATVAVRAGITQGFVELRQSFTRMALVGQLFWPVATLAAVVVLRGTRTGGFTLGTLVLPGVLGMFIALGMLLSVQYLAADREDGTLLRAKAIPNGMRGYFIGKLVTVSGTIVAYLVILLVPGLFLVDSLDIEAA
ncbi:ABC transporter ATP-binding protein [Specibacter cremeus]|uniref:ABC transporter ATP-binding protein n=1 Tax=Specibacter cremeus TaxID=1629051 RepID=UPI001F0CD4FB|nr:ABC transporter ATP-binding protein [Specibacter cremeus]